MGTHILQEEPALGLIVRKDFNRSSLIVVGFSALVVVSVVCKLEFITLLQQSLTTRKLSQPWSVRETSNVAHSQGDSAS